MKTKFKRKTQNDKTNYLSVTCCSIFFCFPIDDQLAILYNDSSVLENHHLAIAFSLLGQPGHDVFENFPRKQRLSSRRMIIDMVS